MVLGSSYFHWLGERIQAPGDLGRHLGGNKAVVGDVGVFNGPVVYVNVGSCIYLFKA
jgi:hypothetical protein